MALRESSLCYAATICFCWQDKSVTFFLLLSCWEDGWLNSARLSRGSLIICPGPRHSGNVENFHWYLCSTCHDSVCDPNSEKHSLSEEFLHVFSFKQRFMSYCREWGWGLRKVILCVKPLGCISWVCECAWVPTEMQANSAKYRFQSIFIFAFSHKILFNFINADHSCIRFLKYNLTCFYAIGPQINLGSYLAFFFFTVVLHIFVLLFKIPPGGLETQH